MAFEWLENWFSGPKFSSDRLNTTNSPNSPDAQAAAQQSKKVQQGPGGEALGMYANDYGPAFNRSPVLGTQTEEERDAQKRANYYYGGTRQAGQYAAENATNTGRYYGNQLGQNAATLNARGDQVFNRFYGAPGPSAAQAVLNQGTNQALGSQLALARSGRGMGQSASAMTAAQGNAVGLQTTAANNAAILRAQEMENYAQRRDAAQRANDQTALGFATLGQGGIQSAGQTSLAGQNLANQVNTNALTGNTGYENNLLQYYNIKTGGNLAQNQIDQQNQNAAIAAIGTYAAAASDERVKRDVYKLSPIEAKKDAQLGSSGDFDALAQPTGAFPSVAQGDQTTTMPTNIFARPARTTKISPYYQPPKSAFANELQNDPNAGNPDARSIVDPWASREASQDPWAKYLADRQRKEDEQRYNEQSQQAGQTGLHAGLGAVGLGALLAYALSDENEKTEKKRIAKNKAKRSGQRLAQAPLLTVPATSQRPANGDMLSDANSKAWIKSLADENERLTAENQWMAPRLAPGAMSQAPSSTQLIYEARGYLPMPTDQGDAAQQAMRAAPGYSYKYKQPDAPGAAPGTHYGPMAQDLEKTPAGRSTVVQAPNGTKMVDTGRLALVNTAALHAQQEDIDELKRRLAVLGGLSGGGSSGAQLGGMSASPGAVAGAAGGSAAGRIFASRGM